MCIQSKLLYELVCFFQELKAQSVYNKSEQHQLCLNEGIMNTYKGSYSEEYVKEK